MGGYFPLASLFSVERSCVPPAQLEIASSWSAGGYNLIHVGPKWCPFKLPRHALLDRANQAKAPRLGLLTGRELDRSTCVCHELHSNNVRSKTKATTHAKMSAPAELQLARRARGRAGLSGRQRQTEPYSAFRIDARRGSSDRAR